MQLNYNLQATRITSVASSVSTQARAACPVDKGRVRTCLLFNSLFGLPSCELREGVRRGRCWKGMAKAGPLGGSFPDSDLRSVRHHHRRCQHQAYQADDPPVRHAFCDPGEQALMMNIGKYHRNPPAEKDDTGAMQGSARLAHLVARTTWRSGRGVGLSTVKDFESGKRTPIEATQRAMQAALEQAGIGFSFLLDDGGSYASGITFSKLNA